MYWASLYTILAIKGRRSWSCKAVLAAVLAVAIVVPATAAATQLVLKVVSWVAIVVSAMAVKVQEVLEQ